MFQKIRYRLLLSYLVVFASLLGIFAIAVRVAFTRSLTEQITDKLIAIGKGAAANVEFEKGRLTVESDFRPQDLITYHQALQWFDTQGNLITQQGQTVLTLPLLSNKMVQVQTGKIPIQWQLSYSFPCERKKKCVTHLSDAFKLFTIIKITKLKKTNCG